MRNGIIQELLNGDWGRLVELNQLINFLYEIYGKMHYFLHREMANTVQVSNFRYMVYLFSLISIKLSLK